MYGLPFERTGKMGRLKKYGERLLLEDFVLEFPKTTDWKISVRSVLTGRWGERVVYAIVTLQKVGMGATGFSSIQKIRKAFFNYSNFEDETIPDYGE